MEKVHLSRTRIVSLFNAVVLSLALPFLLVACGGGADSGISGNSTSTTSNDTPITPNSAALAWDAVAATNLSGYRVYYGTAPGVYLQSFGQGLSVGNITSYTLMGLSNGTRYYFAVTAFDTTGHESGYSNEAFKDIP
jgi:hypothetical protein